MTVHRGDIYYADLSPVVGSEQGGIRPVLIVQNDVGNRFSPTVIAAAITSQKGKTDLPTHIRLDAGRLISLCCFYRAVLHCHGSTQPVSRDLRTSMMR